MIFKFNTAKAVAYAYSYLEKSNPFYKVFDKKTEGVNFISQCVLAGCENTNAKTCPDWFYENEKSYSESWVSDDAFLKYLISQNTCGAIGRLTQKNLLTIGDLVFYQTGNQKNGVGIITKICNDEIFFVSKGEIFGEVSIDKCGFDKEIFVHIIGVKK